AGRRGRHRTAGARRTADRRRRRTGRRDRRELSDMDFRETEEQAALRNAVAELGKRYGHSYTAPRARAREPLTELWDEAGRAGFLGLNLPEQYGGGGA